MSGLLKKIMPTSRQTLTALVRARYSVAVGSKEHIDGLVKSNKIVVFMKGTPDAPRCGFSNAVIQILKFHGVRDYIAHDVLQNEDIRQGVKTYSSWPTIPQVFFNGEFLGGCDILLEMHQNGEFIEELKKVDIKSALLDNPDKKPE